MVNLVRVGVQTLACLALSLGACGATGPITDAQRVKQAVDRLAQMSGDEVRGECESPSVQDQGWFGNPQYAQRYRRAACERSVLTEQRRWIGSAPCDEIKRRLFQDVPYRPDVVSTGILRTRLWTCKLTTMYFDHLEVEAVASKDPAATMAQGLKALHGSGEPIVDTLLSYLEAHQAAPFHSISKPIYGVFRGFGRWLGVQQASRCMEVAGALLLSIETDAKRAAVEYKGINGFIHGLHDAKCYSGMSLLAAREVRVRALRAESEGSKSALGRCRWLVEHGTFEARDDLRALFANPTLARWVDRFSPKCRAAFERLK